MPAVDKQQRHAHIAQRFFCGNLYPRHVTLHGPGRQRRVGQQTLKSVACNGYRYFDKEAITQVRQIQRLIATGFSVAEISRFPDCMLLVEGASFCPETQAVQYQRLKDIEEQISELEQRKARLLETLRQNGNSDAGTLHE